MSSAGLERLGQFERGSLVVGRVGCKRGRRLIGSARPSSSVFARVSSTIVKPRLDRPYEGILSIHFELSPMASTSYETGR